MQQTGANQDKFIWNTIPSLEDLGRIRMEAMRRFLASYEDGRVQGRYIPGELPELPFADQTFDLALSSHFLFLYTDNLSFEFHVSAICEMLRVACEVRIFPLLDMNARESHYLNSILENFQKYKPEICQVNYEFQRGGNRMLVLRND
jgi:ubiquinone/menaquinone biosynthesis C-methylase UbiE